MGKRLIPILIADDWDLIPRFQRRDELVYGRRWQGTHSPNLGTIVDHPGQPGRDLGAEALEQLGSRRLYIHAVMVEHPTDDVVLSVVVGPVDGHLLQADDV